MKKIKVDILEENPLKVILKNGFIPVVRFSDEGFKNYNQNDYFNKKEIKGTVFNGCFCNLGGIQGRWVSGHHYKEDLYIGYIKPSTKVFSTYFYYEDNFKETTAEYRYSKALSSYNICYSDYDGVFSDGNLEDFDMISEAIVNANDIKFVCKISFEELFNLSKYYKDGYLRFLSLEDLFFAKVNDYNFKFFKLLNLGNSSKEIFDFYDDCRNFSYKRKLLEAFYKYICKNKDFVDFNKLNSFKDDIFEFEEWLKVLRESSYKELGVYELKFFYNESSFYFKLQLDSFKCKMKSFSMDINDGIFSFDKIVKKPYPYINNQREELVKLTFNDLLDKDLFPYLFFSLIILKKYVDTFSKYYEINMSNTYYQLLALKELIENIEKEGKNLSVSKNDYVLDIDILDGIKLEFNLILKDFVVTIEDEDDFNKFFNINNIPLEYERVKDYIDDFILDINFKKGDFYELLKN